MSLLSLNDLIEQHGDAGQVFFTFERGCNVQIALLEPFYVRQVKWSDMKRRFMISDDADAHIKGACNAYVFGEERHVVVSFPKTFVRALKQLGGVDLKRNGLRVERASNTSWSLTPFALSGPCCPRNPLSLSWLAIS